uniref:Peptidase A1 domain-containing protein n=1 Tax=Spongospora subterranea TaxID=70186 RepID=A0A0H5QH04_9EUKA|eukprot:CRZ01265.1 hypothetical protein [Spongospora subterranea]
MRIIVLVLLTVSAQSLLHSPLLRRFGPLDVGKRSSSSAIFNFQGVQFYGEITVGTPGQKIPALFDTGSYDTWMPATSYCSTISCHSGGYQSGDSSTSAVTTDPFEVLYLSSSVSGNYVKDTISIGSLHSVQPIAMGVVQGKSGFPSQHAFDGLVGMGPNSSVLHSLLDLAVSDATGERRMFSMYLSDDTSGSLTLGGYDETHLAGDNSSQLVWLESYSTNSAWALPYWILPSAAIEFGGEKLSSAAVVVDSGSSFIIGPQS